MCAFTGESYLVTEQIVDNSDPGLLRRFACRTSFSKKTRIISLRVSFLTPSAFRNVSDHPVSGEDPCLFFDISGMY